MPAAAGRASVNRLAGLLVLSAADQTFTAIRRRRTSMAPASYCHRFNRQCVIMEAVLLPVRQRTKPKTEAHDRDNDKNVAGLA